MTSSATRWARVVSDNMEQFRFPYHGGARGEIILRRHPRYGQDVIFQLERGQIICHRECSVLVRFDDRAPYRVTGVEAADNDPTVLFLRGFRRLTTDMARASIMRVSITVHHEGDRVFTFPVSGLDLRRK